MLFTLNSVIKCVDFFNSFFLQFSAMQVLFQTGAEKWQVDLSKELANKNKVENQPFTFICMVLLSVSVLQFYYFNFFTLFISVNINSSGKSKVKSYLLYFDSSTTCLKSCCKVSQEQVCKWNIQYQLKWDPAGLDPLCVPAETIVGPDRQI